MATHSSILVEKITCSEEPGRLQSIRVAKRQDCTHTHIDIHTLLCLK